MRGPGTRHIDGRGIAFVPGLTDSHIHPLMGTLRTRGADLFDATSLDEIRARLAAERQRVGPDGWLQGWGLHYEPSRKRGNSGDLFDSLAGQPMLLEFFDGHTALANRAALALAGINGAASRSRRRRRSSAPTAARRARFWSAPRWASCRTSCRKTDAETPTAGYAETVPALQRVGLTGAARHGRHARGARRPTAAGGERRAHLPHGRPALAGARRHDAEMRERLAFGTKRGRLWRCGAAKFFIDGVDRDRHRLAGRAGHEGPGRASRSGPSPSATPRRVRSSPRAGFQCITHAVGDGRCAARLDAYEAAGLRLAFITASSTSSWSRQRRAALRRTGRRRLDAAAAHGGPRRADGGDEWAAAARPGTHARGVPPARPSPPRAPMLALGSDWMVAAFDPRLGMAWARLRRTPGLFEMPPRAGDQALTALQTLEGYTTAAAKTVSEDEVSGRVKPGYRADLSGFAADPVDTDADSLLDLPILMTIVDGRIVYEAR